MRIESGVKCVVNPCSKRHDREKKTETDRTDQRPTKREKGSVLYKLNDAHKGSFEFEH